MKTFNILLAAVSGFYFGYKYAIKQHIDNNTEPCRFNIDGKEVLVPPVACDLLNRLKGGL